MKELTIKASLRDKVGKAEAGRLRRKGMVPCVLYGVEKDSVALMIVRKDLEKLLSQTRSVFNVDYENKQQPSVVKEIQYHPVRGDILHVDMQRVQAGQEINVTVPINFVGNAPGVKAGGIFQEIRSELEITCLPKDIPEEIVVDISLLEIGDSIHISELKLENITIRAEAESTLCLVAVPKKLEELLPEEEEEEVEEEEAEPEVISKGKEEEEEEESKKEE
jgi:large subunit ribosomal protein L25